MVDSYNEEWYVSIESNGSFSRKMGKLVLLRKMEKIGVSALENGVSATGNGVSATGNGGKMLLKGCERKWIMIWSETSMFPKPKINPSCIENFLLSHPPKLRSAK